MNNNQEEKINWVSVINFLQKQYTQISLKQKQWKYEKEVLTQRIGSLEAELRSNVVVCEDLINRIKILEIALKEEKSKKNHSKTLADSKQIASALDKFNLTKYTDKNNDQEFLKKYRPIKLSIMTDLKIFSESPARILENVYEEKLSNLHKDKKFHDKKKFGGHLDIITALVTINESQPLFATASQDCLIKIWSLASVLKQENPEPKHTLRKHTGPLFSLTGGHNPFNKSGGIEGDIKSWKIDKGGVDWTGNFMNGTEQEQTIWDLQMMGEKLLSSSSDGVVRLFKVDNADQKLQLVLSKQYKQKQFNQTSVKWVSDQLFVSGCSSAPRISLWNIEGKLSQKYIYQIQKAKEPQSVQTNRLEINKDLKLIIAGCEDGFLRCFDYNNAKIIQKLQIHSSITSLLCWDNQIVAGDYKGSLHFWDMRNFKLLDVKQQAHLQKYQTGVNCLGRLNNYLLSSGADGIVKIFN